MTKVLLFHIYPVNNWKEVTQMLLTDVPHEEVFVHISLDRELLIDPEEVKTFLSSFNKIKAFFCSPNSPHPEVDAMEVFRAKVDFSNYSILTYMHAKGVTKPDDKNVKDWIELMRYFIIDKMSSCIRVFERGYLMYGVNKTPNTDSEGDFKGADFFYAGNFVSVNLTAGMIEKIRITPLAKEYYGLEGFWGKLCESRLAYNVFHSRINHYLTPFPGHYYKTWQSRTKYSVASYCYHEFYRIKQFIKGYYGQLRRT